MSFSSSSLYTVIGLVFAFSPCVSIASAELPIELTVEGGKVAGGPRVIRLKRDESVTLMVRADTPDELHVHGYDLHAHVGPSRTATLKFVAKRTGRFGIELHKSGIDLATLEIYPK